MTMSDWDGTPWAGTKVITAHPVPNGPDPRAAVVSGVSKATMSAYGPGVNFYVPGASVLSTFGRSPLRTMREAQQLYHTHPWIGAAERAVTRKVSGMPWHIDDADTMEVDDQTVDPVLRAIRDLLEKPQAALPPEQRQQAIQTGRALKEITSRHMGLCGVSYWFPDQPDLNGIPLALLYVNPARVLPKRAESGRIIGWILDPKDETGRGGTPLDLDDLIPFYLEVPDWGVDPVGLVESAALKAKLTGQADMHASLVMSTGGRIAGIVAPKEGYINDSQQWEDLVADFRQVNSAPDAAKRTTVLRGPVEFHKTAADPTEMTLGDIGKSNRDDIFAIWGVPPSQAGVSGQSVGMNSGETRRYERQILMEGPVHDRVSVLQETIQFQLLDLWQKIGRNPQIGFDEPNFDDQAVPYELAAKAEAQPMTVNERRAVLDLDPLPDYGPDGKALGVAILLPSKISAWAQGAETGSTKGNEFKNAPAEEPEPEPPPVLPAGAPTVPTPALPLAKAASEAEFLAMRGAIGEQYTPAMETDLRAFLDKQREDILTRLGTKADHVLRKPAEVSAWWRADHWNAELARVLQPHLSGIIGSTYRRAGELLGQQSKAAEDIEGRVLAHIGVNIKNINETTRQRIATIIGESVRDGSDLSDVRERVAKAGVFNDSRADMIARTETANTYNRAAAESYREYGIRSVMVIDGDEDGACARANGSIWSLDEAYDRPTEHPNCTRDFAPAFA